MWKVAEQLCQLLAQGPSINQELIVDREQLTLGDWSVVGGLANTWVAFDGSRTETFGTAREVAEFIHRKVT